MWKTHGRTAQLKLGHEEQAAMSRQLLNSSKVWDTYTSRINRTAAVSHCWPAAQPFRVQGKNKHYYDTIDIQALHICSLFMKNQHKNEHKFKNGIIVLLMGKVVTDHTKKLICLVRKDQENWNLHLNKNICCIHTTVNSIIITEALSLQRNAKIL